MPLFIRSVTVIIFVVGLSFVIGCASAQSGIVTSAFPWAKPKEPEKAEKTTMHDFLARERIAR